MVAQLVIAICGALTVWLSQSVHHNARRWASVVGLIAQPAWVYATWEADQYGMLALTVIYTAGWMRGFYNHWIVAGRSK